MKTLTIFLANGSTLQFHDATLVVSTFPEEFEFKYTSKSTGARKCALFHKAHIAGISITAAPEAPAPEPKEAPNVV